MPLDLLSKICREIDERLDELRPLLAEHERLLDAADALEAASSGMVAAETLELPPAPQSTDSDAVKRRTSRTRVAARVSRSAPGAARSAARPKLQRAAGSPAGETILAALEHGSHTVGELAVVTAMSGPSINGNLRKLVSEGAIVKTEREGKAAWALAAAA
ncbi:MAG TPA: helix-turn-helix domain-containing protein [Solirubrobacteraceae bacterium]|jgi:hypothetical protein|nr:helix-turn-helix domain-containing protein [Solirubrobacteraceae bacterium]